MNSRIDPDALDTLHAYERQAAYRADIRARMERQVYESRPCTGVWAPTMTEQQKQEREQYVLANCLPF